jgi:hypothetical protein
LAAVMATATPMTFIGTIVSVQEAEDEQECSDGWSMMIERELVW